MKQNLLRNLGNYFSSTPVHPQWFTHLEQKKSLKIIKPHLSGKILDIGCADCYIKSLLENDSQYIGLDYPKTASEMYHTIPSIYGDAHTLPFADLSVNIVTLLDVLEHLHTPEDCIKEIQRVLKPNGTLILQVPFLYPIHDAPYDFHRWTQYALHKLLEKYGFKVDLCHSQGTAPKTFSLLTNIGLAKICMDLIKVTKIFVIFIPLLSILIILINTFGLILSYFSRDTSFMPYGYLLICRKK